MKRCRQFCSYGIYLLSNMNAFLMKCVINASYQLPKRDEHVSTSGISSQGFELKLLQLEEEKFYIVQKVTFWSTCGVHATDTHNEIYCC